MHAQATHAASGFQDFRRGPIIGRQSEIQSSGILHFSEIHFSSFPSPKAYGKVPFSLKTSAVTWRKKREPGSVFDR